MVESNDAAVERLAKRIRAEADIADRPGQYDRLNQIALDLETFTGLIDASARAVPAHNNLADKVRALASEWDVRADETGHRDAVRLRDCAREARALLGEGATTEGGDRG